MSIKAKFSSISKGRKLGALLFAQLWLWPQVATYDMPPNIAVPLFITAFISFMVNAFFFINTVEAGL